MKNWFYLNVIINFIHIKTKLVLISKIMFNYFRNLIINGIVKIEENMIHENPYNEAMRYVDNARIQLKQAGKDDKFYIDAKYVKSACGIAYSGALVALDYLFDIKKIPSRRRRKSIEYYQKSLAQIDKRLLKHLNSAYRLLHLDGYYDGETDIKAIEAGFDNAISVIDALKPYSKNEV